MENQTHTGAALLQPRLVLPSFTPGPWHCESSLGLVRSAADQRIICAMPHALNKRAIKMRKPGDDAEITADARLIAAAPEMLKALLEIFARPEWQDPEVGFMSGHIAAHAIRKAMGEEAGNAALGLSRQNVNMEARDQ